MMGFLFRDLIASYKYVRQYSSIENERLLDNLLTYYFLAGKLLNLKVKLGF